MELGIVCNIFRIDLSSYMSNIAVCQRSRYPNLEDLRSNFKNQKVFFYADKAEIYSYGSNLKQLSIIGFKEDIIDLHDQPRLASAIIKDGFINHLIRNKFEIFFNKGRIYAYNVNKPISIDNTDLSLINGFDFNIFYLYDIDTISFVISIDTKYKIIDKNNSRFSFYKIKKEYNSNILSQIRIKQGDILPLNNTMNTEVSKERLLNHIIPFVKNNTNFVIPNGKNATLEDEPLKIVIGK